MSQKSGITKLSSERIVKDIRRATRKQYSAEEKIRIVLDGLRGVARKAPLASLQELLRPGAITHCRGFPERALQSPHCAPLYFNVVGHGDIDCNDVTMFSHYVAKQAWGHPRQDVAENVRA